MPVVASQEFISDAELLSLGIASNALGAIPVGDRDRARRSACGYVASRIAKRHRLPLIEWGEEVIRACAHIASYDLLCRRGFNPQAGNDVAIRDRYLEAVQWARDIADGRAELVNCVDSSPDIEERGPLVATSDGGPLWGDFGAKTPSC